ncbi:reverse transcriptase domain-containing protein [Citrus sinensis]|nr:reverse transcriptase domain-containing protein [Citrus sinensis]
MTGYYRYPESARRRDSWNLLCYLATISSLPWVCLGDFNDLFSNSEKRGRRAQPNWKLNGFREAMVDSGLVDLGMEGYQFTWEQGRGTSEWVEERLDRVLANRAWCSLFPTAKVWSLEASCSNHLPIFLDPKPSTPIPRHNRFRFENLWMREQECEQIISRSWSSTDGLPIQQKLNVCGVDLLKWGGKLVRDFCNRIAGCKKKMNMLRASTKKKKNTIEKLRNNQGMWVSNTLELDDLIVEHFQKLFSSGGCFCDPIVSCIEPSVIVMHNQLLLEPFTAVDVKEALFSMHPDKSLGPDGMNPAFYQKVWNIIGQDVTDACLHFISTRTFPDELNDTLIVLIPKKLQPETLTDMRPIALCNSAFVPGRAITDNILISAEIVHFLKRKKQGKMGTSAFKIDMSKAYDRIEWDFLKAVMLRMRFDKGWVDLIMLCVSTVRYKVLRNGAEVGPIIPSRGLRQGDPLSPYLFIICAEGLSSLIRNREMAGFLHGIKVAKNTPSISHIFFADDCLLFFKANLNEARIIKRLLAIYGAASGQQVNYKKSAISFSANMDEVSKGQVCEVLEVSTTSNHENYLGLPSQIGKKKSVVFNFIKDKVWQRLQGWNQKFLSKARKEIILKTVAQAIPNYAMNIYLLPVDLCKELEIMMNSFWWGTKRNGGQGIHWCRWDSMCKPKSFGGIGLKKIRDFNIAMLGKQCWKLMTNPQSLVARILKARYYPNRLQIGSGQQVQITKDLWLPDVDNGCITTVLDESLATATVNCLMVPGQRRWDNDFVANVFNDRGAAFILQVPLSARHDKDYWFWLVDSKGNFTIRSCYELLNPIADAPSSKVWKCLWRLEIPMQLTSRFYIVWWSVYLLILAGYCPR